MRTFILFLFTLPTISWAKFELPLIEQCVLELQGGTLQTQVFRVERGRKFELPPYFALISDTDLKGSHRLLFQELSYYHTYQLAAGHSVRGKRDKIRQVALSQREYESALEVMTKVATVDLSFSQNWETSSLAQVGDVLRIDNETFIVGEREKDNLIEKDGQPIDRYVLFEYAKGQTLLEKRQILTFDGETALLENSSVKNIAYLGQADIVVKNRQSIVNSFVEVTKMPPIRPPKYLDPIYVVMRHYRKI